MSVCSSEEVSPLLTAGRRARFRRLQSSDKFVFIFKMYTNQSSDHVKFVFLEIKCSCECTLIPGSACSGHRSGRITCGSLHRRRNYR